MWVSTATSTPRRRRPTLGLVPLGYADGILRSATGGSRSWPEARADPSSQDLRLDQFMIDVGGAPLADGDEVVLFEP
ncbi:hypothetical protein GCM10020219_038430 [Nonomuraea dietziae]